jgi:hypothetical protein
MANHTPTAAGHNQTAAPGTVIALSTLFTYSDADGLSDIVTLDVQDRTAGGGHLTFNGVTQADNTVWETPISQIGSWAYVVGPSGSVDTIGFNVTDHAGAFNTSVTATVTATSTNHTPTAQGFNQTAAPGTIIPLSTLFTYSDADGLSDIVTLDVQDRTAGGGHLTFNGVTQADNTVWETPIGQIGSWAYVVGPSGSVDTIGFNVTDHAGAFNTSVTATVTAQTTSGLHINLVYDAQALAAPQSFRDGMQAAANLLQAAFNDNITVNVAVGYGEFGGVTLSDQSFSFGNIGYTGNGTNGVGINETYSNLRTLLLNHEGDADDITSVNALTNTTSLQGQSNFVIGRAQAKALGEIVTPNDSVIDGQVGMGTFFTGDVLIAGALHEITHAMGRIAGLSLDLFRFNENHSGNHVFGFAIPATPAYFSIDGGATDLADFGITSDPGDFLNGGVQGIDPFNESVGGNSLTPVDVQIMDVLGFHRTGSGNHAPTITSDGGGDTANVSVAENSTAVTTVTANDQDGNALSYALGGGVDQAKFQINSTTGALSFITAPNFEAPGSAANSNSYVVQVRVADNGSPNLADTQTITVNVTDVNDIAPLITTATTQSVPENTTFVAALTSTDVDTVGTNPASFSIIGGNDAAKFAVSSGNLVFAAAPDFENPTDSDHDNVYIVQVTAFDGVHNTNRTISVTVTDVNETGSVSINDATITEGNSGTKVETFTVTRSGGSAAFDVNFSTADGSATVADHDYVANSGTLHFGAGVNSQPISVTVNGDTKVEAHEAFFVNLSGATNGAIITDSQGTGTIFDDDRAPLHDFNGDGNTDILWRSGNGTVATWNMNDKSILASNAFLQVSNDWKIAGTGDFNGDGKTDILWRNDNGTVATWSMNEKGILASNSFPQVSNDWKIAGTGDFNGDGKTDILWRNDNGTVATWNMSDKSILGSNTFLQVSNDWKIAGTGDFNGDGKDDILWRNDNGTVATWNMGDKSILASNTFLQVSNDWKIAGTGDFNADHLSDILWRNDNGTVATWEMSDNHILASNTFPQVSTDWHIA